MILYISRLNEQLFFSECEATPDIPRNNNGKLIKGIENEKFYWLDLHITGFSPVSIKFNAHVCAVNVDTF